MAFTRETDSLIKQIRFAKYAPFIEYTLRTTNLITHLKRRHGISVETPISPSSSEADSRRSSSFSSTHGETSISSLFSGYFTINIRMRKNHNRCRIPLAGFCVCLEISRMRTTLEGIKTMPPTATQPR